MHGQGFAGGRKAQRAELGGSCKGSWAGQGGNTQIEAQCIPTSHERSIADANALPGVLHAIAQRRPRAHFRAGDDTAELAILPPPRDRDRSRVGALYVGNLSLLGGLSRKCNRKRKFWKTGTCLVNILFTSQHGSFLRVVMHEYTQIQITEKCVRSLYS